MLNVFVEKVILLEEVLVVLDELVICWVKGKIVVVIDKW